MQIKPRVHKERALNGNEARYLAIRNFGCLGVFLAWHAAVYNLRALNKMPDDETFGHRLEVISAQPRSHPETDDLISTRNAHLRLEHEMTSSGGWVRARVSL
jgi:hypothetical protein